MGERQQPAALTGGQLGSLNQLAPLQAALAYAEIGWPVFPVAPLDRISGRCGCKDGPACESIAKHPLVRWSETASTDPEQIRSWWAWKPSANIGVPTGARSGLVVVDIDRQHDGPATRQSLAAAGVVFPPTLAARTRNGGWHFFYRAPEGTRVANTTAELAGIGKTPGIDVRGDGGYIIAAPSVRPLDPDPTSGSPRFGRYRWVERSLPLASAPSWVVAPRQSPAPAVSRQRSSISDRPGPDPTKRAAAALGAEVARVTGSVDQGRNNALFKAAANCFEIVNTGWLDETEVRAELTAAGLAVGLGEREIRQTLDAQWRRKQGVARSGWPPATGPRGADRNPLRARGDMTMLDAAAARSVRVEGFGR